MNHAGYLPEFVTITDGKTSDIEAGRALEFPKGSNAVMTRIWIALSVYLLLAFIKFQSKLKKSMQKILRLLQLNLFDKRNPMALLRGDSLHERNSQIKRY